MAPPANFFLLWAFWLILFRACWEFSSYSRKTIENLQFAVQIGIFPQNTFFCSTTAYSGLCSSDHPCIKSLFLVGCLSLGVIYSEKKFKVRRSPPKMMSIISASANLFERLDAHIQAYAAVSEQQNCSNSMWKLARDLKVGPLDCARSALHTYWLHFWPL